MKVKKAPSEWRGCCPERAGGRARIGAAAEDAASRVLQRRWRTFSVWRSAQRVLNESREMHAPGLVL